MDWFWSFPHLSDNFLRDMRRTIDDGFRVFTRNYGDQLEAVFDPLRVFLVWAERLMLNTPWPIVLLVIAAIAWFASRSIWIVLGSMITLLLIGMFDMWDDTMRTISMILVCTVLAIALGIPIGILMARSDRVRNVINPILDVMQTLPSFVYLIPVVMLFGLGKIPAIIATVIYAVPPLIRLTDLGIRLVDREVLEASRAFGATPRQQLFGVQLPLALPNIMAGINQTTMMALSMVVIASMIGARGLGHEVLLGINRLEVGRGLMAGLAIVALAILFDRITQSYGHRVRKGAQR